MIKAFNPDLKKPDIIYPGQELILPTRPIAGLSPEPESASPAPETAVEEPKEPDEKPMVKDKTSPQPPVEPEKDKTEEPPAATTPPVSATAEPAAAPKPEPEPEPKPELKPELKPESKPELKPEPAKPAASKEHEIAVVEKGDSLSTILRRAGVPEEMIFTGVLARTLALNPQIKDPNIIYQGQKIVIPSRSTWEKPLFRTTQAPCPRTCFTGRHQSQTRSRTRTETDPAHHPGPHASAFPQFRGQNGPGPDIHPHGGTFSVHGSTFSTAENRRSDYDKQSELSYYRTP